MGCESHTKHLRSTLTIIVGVSHNYSAVPFKALYCVEIFVLSPLQLVWALLLSILRGAEVVNP